MSIVEPAATSDPTDPPGSDPTDPPGSDPTDPAGSDPMDPPGSDPTDPPGSGFTIKLYTHVHLADTLQHDTDTSRVHCCLYTSTPVDQ